MSPQGATGFPGGAGRVGPPGPAVSFTPHRIHTSLGAHHVCGHWQQRPPPHDLRRATLDPLDLPDPLARKDPKETVVILDLLVALARLALLELLDHLARRVALVLMALL